MTTHTLCAIDDIEENHCKGFLLGDTNLFVVKKMQKVFVYRNHCPHLGLPLEWMPDQFLDNDKQYIQCATHGALFKINNGECISGPCLGQQLEAINFSLEDEQIVVDIE